MATTAATPVTAAPTREVYWTTTLIPVMEASTSGGGSLWSMAWDLSHFAILIAIYLILMELILPGSVLDLFNLRMVVPPLERRPPKDPKGDPREGEEGVWVHKRCARGAAKGCTKCAEEDPSLQLRIVLSELEREKEQEQDQNPRDTKARGGRREKGEDGKQSAAKEQEKADQQLAEMLAGEEMVRRMEAERKYP